MSMDSKEFSKLIRSFRACEEACDWAKGKSLAEVWEQCERGDWLLWLCGRMADKPGWPTRNEVILAACDCAETALKYVKPGEDRPRLAIECARRFAAGLATRQDAASAASAYAASAASAYAASAASAYAAYAAYASAYAASAASAYAAAAAASAAAAAYADAAAADDAAAAAAKTKTQKECADLVRKRITLSRAVGAS